MFFEMKTFLATLRDFWLRDNLWVRVTDMLVERCARLAMRSGLCTYTLYTHNLYTLIHCAHSIVSCA